MKFTQLILTSLVAGTAYANSNVPLSFFAKVDNSLKPLSDLWYDVNGLNSSILSYGTSLISPVEFALSGNYAVTTDTCTPGFVSFYDGVVMFGSTFNPGFLRIDHGNRIGNHPFLSCDILGTQRRGIFYGASSLPIMNCFQVEIYLLPYDKDFGKTAKNVPGLEKEMNYKPNKEKTVPEIEKTVSGKEEQKSMEPSSGSPTLPLVLFAKISGTYIPLSNTLSRENESQISILSYRTPPGVPVQFTLLNNYLFTTGTATPGFVGIIVNPHEKFFAFGPSVHPTRLDFDSEMRVTNGNFFRCNTPSSKSYWLFHRNLPLSPMVCHEVDIYLLPYDKTTGTVKALPAPVLGADDKEVSESDVKQTSDSRDKDNTESIEEDKTNHEEKIKTDSDKKSTSKKSSPSSLDLPLVFFAKVEDTLVPLSGKIYEKFSTELNVFTYTGSVADPVEFTLKGKYAVTTDTSNPRYVGFLGGRFGFGPRIKKQPLNINRKGKVLNYPFYSCMGQDEVVSGIAFSDLTMADCFEVDVYLLPFDKETRSPVRIMPEPDNKGKYVPKSPVEPFLVDSGGDISPASKDMANVSVSKSSESESLSTNSTESSFIACEYSYNTSTIQFSELRRINTPTSTSTSALCECESIPVVTHTEYYSYCDEVATVTTTVYDKVPNVYTITVSVISTVTVTSATTLTVTRD